MAMSRTRATSVQDGKRLSTCGGGSSSSRSKSRGSRKEAGRGCHAEQAGRAQAITLLPPAGGLGVSFGAVGRWGASRFRSNGDGDVGWRDDSACPGRWNECMVATGRKPPGRSGATGQMRGAAGSIQREDGEGVCGRGSHPAARVDASHKMQHDLTNACLQIPGDQPRVSHQRPDPPPSAYAATVGKAPPVLTTLAVAAPLPVCSRRLSSCAPQGFVSRDTPSVGGLIVGDSPPPRQQTGPGMGIIGASVLHIAVTFRLGKTWR